MLLMLHHFRTLKEHSRIGDQKKNLSVFFNKFIYFIYLFLAALGLRCCTWASSSYGTQGLLFIVVCGLLIVVASLVTEHGF